MSAGEIAVADEEGLVASIIGFHDASSQFGGRCDVSNDIRRCQTIASLISPSPTNRMIIV